jgi:CheY-like chemotaxis protein
MRSLDHNSIDPPTETSQVAEGDPRAQQAREKHGVLVVDDDNMVRIMVQLGLEEDGFNVWPACNGREAIQLYQTHRDRITIVLLDVHMPGLDGPATLDALRNLDPDVLACFMSGDLGDYEPEELRRRGAAHVITKPFLLKDLALILRHLTRGAPADLLPVGGRGQG